MKKRVVITGIGLVTPLGNTLDEFSERLIQGESAAAPITLFSPGSYPTTIAAQVDTSGFSAKSKDRKISFAIESARAAMNDANREGSLSAHYSNAPCGLSLGIGLELFSMPDFIEYKQLGKIPQDQHPLTFIQSPSDICLHQISLEHRLNTAPYACISACAASTDAIGTAFKLVQDGKLAWVMTGGADSMINPLGVGGFCRIGAMTTCNDNPKTASRPFDRNRDGFLLGEGACVFILESMEEAKKRGAHIHAEIVGYGNSLDAYGISSPHPDGEGAFQAMKKALQTAGLNPKDIVHINAHGTSTPANDPIETLAIRRLFGDHADHLTVNGTKSMIGHLISASGAVEVAALIGCAAKGWIHPTINLENPDPACDLNYVTTGPKGFVPGFYLKNSFGFGGQNAVLSLRIGA